MQNTRSVKTVKNYENEVINEEIKKKLLQSEEDYENGRIRNIEDVFNEWKLKYGI